MRARARAANAVGVPAGMFSLVADSGVIFIKLLSQPNKARADNPIKSQPADPFIAHLCQLSLSLSQLR